jgi:type II secretory ATPase GspE/PulE/Tfp pilus assembly ATPase PilB-like protein
MCWVCNQNRYADRIGIHEILEATPTIKRRRISEKKPLKRE